MTTMHPGLQWVGIAFWTFLAISAVAGIVGDYKKKRLMMELLKTAIERGQQLDAAVVEKLVGAEHRKHDDTPQHLQTGGIITIAAGIAVAVLSWFSNEAVSHFPIHLTGVGLAAVCVGVGLFVAGTHLKRTRIKVD